MSCKNKAIDGSCTFKDNAIISIKCLHWGKGGTCSVPNNPDYIIHKTADPMELELVTIACQESAKNMVTKLAIEAQKLLDIFYECSINGRSYRDQKDALQYAINKSLKFAQEQ